MAKTQAYKRRERDWYPTPAWCVDALAEFYSFAGCTILEPAAGDGAMIDALEAHGATVYGEDIHPLRDDIAKADWFEREDCQYTETILGGKAQKVNRFDYVITNPPYDKAGEFIRHALEISNSKTIFAFLLRNEFDCAKSRHDLFSDGNWFIHKIVLTKRPYWTFERKASPRHNYAWYLFNRAVTDGIPSAPEISYWKEAK